MLRTTEELEALSKIDPQLEQILKQIGPLPDITQLEPAQIREAAKLRVRQLPGVADPDFTSVVTEDITIPTRDQQTIPARVYKPANGSADGSPLILNFHGGGFVLGGIENDDLVCKNWTKTLGAVVVSVEYRKAPEFKFPYAVHDAYDSLNWVCYVKDLTGKYTSMLTTKLRSLRTPPPSVGIPVSASLSPALPLVLNSLMSPLIKLVTTNYLHHSQALF